MISNIAYLHLLRHAFLMDFLNVFKSFHFPCEVNQAVTGRTIAVYLGV